MTHGYKKYSENYESRDMTLNELNFSGGYMLHTILHFLPPEWNWIYGRFIPKY